MGDDVMYFIIIFQFRFQSKMETKKAKLKWKRTEIKLNNGIEWLMKRK